MAGLLGEDLLFVGEVSIILYFLRAFILCTSVTGVMSPVYQVTVLIMFKPPLGAICLFISMEKFVAFKEEISSFS